MCFWNASSPLPRIKFALVFLVGFCFLISRNVTAQNQSGFLYGKVTTNSNAYEGPLRWGKEEIYWMDYFNASKKMNQEYRNIPVQKIKDNESWADFDWDIKSIWEDKLTVHQFNCQFGDIKSFKITGGNSAKLQFKNGWETDVMGPGYNDLGEEILVLDKELGLTALNWNKIDKIEFMPSPKKGVGKMGDPVYGVVETSRREKFTGYIQWDHDERLGTDKLDGITSDGKVSIGFSEISAIEKRGNACVVVMKSGRELLVSGSNDVSYENRGVLVLVPGKGSVDVPWTHFKKVTFSQKDDSGPSYESFPAPKPLSGKIFLFDDKELEGRIIFDFDETLDLETLEGNDNGINYTIPFRNIKSIRPKNEEFSLVELKNGENLLLGEGNDVTNANSGLLIFVKGKKGPVHVHRDKIDLITFE